MDRRGFLSINNNAANSAAAPPTSGLEEYNGTWTKKQAAHLLRRTVYGPQFKDIVEFSNLTMKASVNRIFDIPVQEPNDVPINYSFEGDPKVPVGSSWVNKGPLSTANNYRFQSMFGWTIGRMLRKELNLREKMTLFWHNHFVVADMNDARYYYDYIKIFQDNSIGNFKDYVLKITVNPAMLRYLNGNQNTKVAPNENYARELLELFTIGKGPIAGPGDYTNYTENDILEIAKVLTGWVDVGNRNENVDIVTTAFRVNNHETKDKVLSNRFGNAIIKNEGANEYKTLIDIIFKQNEVSKFIARKLYRWFVYYQMDAQVEKDVIEPMAKLIRDNNYDIKPALKALLSSQHFYDNTSCMIKNPMDFVIGGINQFGYQFGGTDTEKYASWLGVFTYTSLLQMRYFDAPNVAGWKAYYQEPVYYQTWVNSVTMPLRKAFTDAISLLNLNARGIRLDVDVLAVVGGFSNPKNIEALITDLATVLLPKELTSGQMKALKYVVNKDLPDSDWTTQYENYLANPTNAAMKKIVDTKLRLLFAYMMQMPEYQLQ